MPWPVAADDLSESTKMPAFKSDFLRVLDERGFIHQISDPEGLDALALKGPITGYVGYDATATSIHIGNLISVTPTSTNMAMQVRL